MATTWELEKRKSLRGMQLDRQVQDLAFIYLRLAYARRDGVDGLLSGKAKIDRTYRTENWQAAIRAVLRSVGDRLIDGEFETKDREEETK